MTKTKINKRLAHSSCDGKTLIESQTHHGMSLLSFFTLKSSRLGHRLTVKQALGSDAALRTKTKEKISWTPLL